MSNDNGGFEVGSMADDSPAINCFRYFLMRLVRLVCCTALECLGLASIIFFGVGLFACFGFLLTMSVHRPWSSELVNIRYEWIRVLLSQPLILSAGSLFVAVYSFGLSMSFGLPWRYKWKMPGAGTVICETCHEESENKLGCTHCGASRTMTRFLTWVAELLNMAVNVLWAIHDVTIGLVCLLK